MPEILAACDRLTLVAYKAYAMQQCDSTSNGIFAAASTA